MPKLSFTAAENSSQSDSSDVEEGMQSKIKRFKRTKFFQTLVERDSREGGWTADSYTQFGDVNSFTVWPWVTWGLGPKSQAKSLVKTLCKTGTPLECWGTGAEQWAKKLEELGWPVPGDEQEEADTLRKEVSRAVNARLQEVKKLYERRREECSPHKQTIRLNSFHEIPRLDPKRWVNSFGNLQRWILRNAVQPPDFKGVIMRALPSNAQRQKVDKVPIQMDEKWEEIVAKVLSAVDENYSFLTYHLELQQLRPHPQETMETYFERFQDYLVVLEMDAIQAGEIFVRGLPEKHQEWARAFSKKKKKPLDAIVEHLHTMAKEPAVKCYVNVAQYPSFMGKSGKKLEQSDKSASKRNGVPKRRNRSGMDSEHGEKRVRMDSCHKCGKPGHWARNCPENKKVDSKPEAARKPAEKPLKFTNKTHSIKKNFQYSANSSMIKIDQSDQMGDPGLLEIEIGTGVEQELERRGSRWLETNEDDPIAAVLKPSIGRLKYSEIELHKCVTKRALLDTGAQTSLITEDTLQEIIKLGKTTIPVDKGSIRIHYGNQTTEMGDLAEIHVKWSTEEAMHTFIVAKNLLEPVILGMDIVGKWAMLDTPVISSIELQEKLEKARIADLEETMSSATQEIELHADHSRYLRELDTELKDNLATEHHHSTIGEIAIEFQDVSMRKQGVWRHQVSMSETGLNQYKNQVQTWLVENVVEEMIDLPTWKRADEEAALYDFIQKGNDQNEFCQNGEFNINGFPIYSGKPRIVHNFKPLNDLIRDDTCDVPGINEAFWKIGQHCPKIFSKIDLRSAYLQIPLRRMDRSVCAFTCDGKRYRFITAPLGLKTIPSQFQRWVKALLQQHECTDFSTNHIDDIIVFSTSISEHMNHVKKVLKALTSVRLTVNPEKCKFFATKLPVLGFWIQVGGMKPNVTKIWNMLEWRRPDSRKKVQSLLGILNFFRRFIPNATSLLWPIMKIRDKTFRWEDQEGAEDAYQKAYQLLVKRGPFLAFPTPGVKIELATDASQFAIGAILFQSVEGERRYLSFNSRVLSEAEQKYSTPKKELISILFHLKYYRDYLLGKKFNLYTDAEALSSVLKRLDQPKKNSILAGWLADIGEYSFDIFHIRGVDNTLPDLASRVQVITIPDEGPHQSGTVSGLEVQRLLEETHKLGHWGTVNMYKHVTQTLGHKGIPNLQESQNCTCRCSTFK